MRLLAWAAASFAVFALVLAPYTVQVTVEANHGPTVPFKNLNDLKPEAVEKGSCQKVEYVAILTGGGKYIAYIGSNDRIVVIEANADKNGIERIYLGHYDEKGNVTISVDKPFTEGDSLCADLDPAGA